jgi:ribonuclease R
MFPEFISNELCSLNIDSDKYSVVFEMGLYDKSIKFYKAKIRIKHRLIYGNDDDFIKTNFPNIISAYNKLKTFNKYKLDLDIKFPTYKFEKNIPVMLKKWYPKPLSSDIIEVFMIECNSRIAEYLSRTSIGIYRHHPEYNKVKLSKLNNYLQHLSWKLQTHQKDYLINDSLNKLLSKYDYNSLKYLILFNTPKAVYSIENSSHSNINRQFYTHVTSPIRRYVDLVIHRLMFNKLSYTINELNEIVKHINFIETRNNDAYRKNDDILVLKYINSQPINTIYNCRVIGMNKFNITLIIENLNYIINLP